MPWQGLSLLGCAAQVHASRVSGGRCCQRRACSQDAHQRLCMTGLPALELWKARPPVRWHNSSLGEAVSCRSWLSAHAAVELTTGAALHEDCRPRHSPAVAGAGHRLFWGSHKVSHLMEKGVAEERPCQRCPSKAQCDKSVVCSREPACVYMTAWRQLVRAHMCWVCGIEIQGVILSCR